MKWEQCEHCKRLFRIKKPFICEDCKTTNSLKSRVNETVYYWANLNVHRATLLKVNDNGQVLINLPDGVWSLKNATEIITSEQFKNEGLQRYLVTQKNIISDRREPSAEMIRDRGQLLLFFKKHFLGGSLNDHSKNK